ncbi:MAG: cell division protein SepF [Eubacteriaceae bacterium]|nr:cell division protein SepF [Eubacteriaceae bacterium]
MANDDYRDQEEKVGFGDKLLGLIGLEVVDVEDEADDEDQFENYENPPVKRSRRSKEERKQEIVKEAAGASGEIVIVEPTRKSDAKIISDELKSGRTVVVHVRAMELEDTTRLYDFITGAAYALNGKVQQVSDNVIVLAPHNIDISTNDTSAQNEEEENISDEVDYGYGD